MPLYNFSPWVQVVVWFASRPKNNAKLMVCQSRDYAPLYEMLCYQIEGANNHVLNGQWQGTAVSHSCIRKELNFSQNHASLEENLNSRKECSLVYTLTAALWDPEQRDHDPGIRTLGDSYSAYHISEEKNKHTTK